MNVFERNLEENATNTRKLSGVAWTSTLNTTPYSGVALKRVLENTFAAEISLGQRSLSSIVED